MKTLRIQTVVAFALICGPVMAAPAAGVAYRARVDVTSDDSVIKTRVTSAVSREIRRLGDVTVAEDNADFVLHIVAIRTKNVRGDDTGYAFALTVTWPKTHGDWPGAEAWLNSFVLTAADLDEICRNSVAYFDTSVMASVRP